MFWLIIVICVYLFIGLMINLVIWLVDDFLGRYLVANAFFFILFLWLFYPLLVIAHSIYGRITKELNS